MNKLTDEEIKQRLIRGSNLERLYLLAKKRIAVLEAENKQLKARIKELEDKDRDKDKRIEDLSFQFEQIKNKLFGKKPDINRILPRKKKKNRDIFSYRRPIPADITETKFHSINVCVHCQGELKNKSVKAFFEEDIPVPIQKIVIKHEVEIGYCPTCKRQSNGYPMPSKKVILGNNVKKYVCILSIANRLSHSQIQDHLKDVFGIALSIGEIGNILAEEADNLRPRYHNLIQSVISQTGAHFDETSWQVQREEQGKFAWVATGTDNNDTVFSLGRSRGKGNVAEIGIPKIGISDNYGAYKNSFPEHQLCWAHPQRKLQDLAESREFGEKKKKLIFKTYEQFSNLYQNIRIVAGSNISSYLQRKFQNIFDQISQRHNLDPTPLVRIKTSLRKNKDKYFTFLNHPGIPLDNNKAERALRHLVIKRRISFGSKTQKGAETTSILASVILSLKWNDPQGWFQKYLKLTA